MRRFWRRLAGSYCTNGVTSSSIFSIMPRARTVTFARTRARTSAGKSVNDDKMDLYKCMAKQGQPFVKLTRLDLTNVNTAGSKPTSGDAPRNLRSKTADVFKPLETFDHKKLHFSMSSVYQWFRKRGEIGNVSLGRNLFHTNAVDSVQVCDDCDEKGNKLIFRCNSRNAPRSFNKQQTEITVTNFQVKGTIAESYCSCDHDGRNGACKHVAALGFTLEHYSQTGQTQANISTRGLSKRTSVQQPKKRSAAMDTETNESDTKPNNKSRKKSSGVLPISLQQLVNYSMNSKAISPAFLSLIPITDASRSLHDQAKV